MVLVLDGRKRKTGNGLIFVKNPERKMPMNVHIEPWMITAVTTILSGVVSATISGIIVHRIQNKLNRRDEERESKEEAKENANKEYNTLILKGLIASLSLGEATANAVETGKYNGKQQKARDYAENVKHDILNFVYEQGTEHMS